MFWLQTFLKTFDLVLQPQKKFLLKKIYWFSFWCISSLQPPCSYCLRNFSVTRCRCSCWLPVYRSSWASWLLCLGFLPGWYFTANLQWLITVKCMLRTAGHARQILLHYASLQQWHCENHSHHDTHVFLHGSHTSSLSHWQYQFLCNSILVKTSKVLFQIGTNGDSCSGCKKNQLSRSQLSRMLSVHK